MMWIERQITSELLRAIKTFPVIVLVGPRQVGKTSVLERTIPEYNYVSLDVPSNAEMAETLPERFLENHPPPLLIDEVQYAPGLFRHLKTWVESRRGQNGLFVLTGSQNFILMEHVSESLAGRAAVIPFLGLSGEEWNTANPLVGGVEWIDFLWRGGFPGLWAEPGRAPNRDRWYQGYVATYLERDVRNLLRIGNLRDFDRFLRACAARCGRLLNMSDLARDVGISTSTARQWISVLQTSNQIFLLEPFHESLGKRLVKSPKLYFTDTGLAAFLMGFQSPGAMTMSRDAGALWENYVVGQWVRWRDWSHPAASLWFWQDRTGAEVDLLVEMDRRLVAIECKFKDRPDHHDIHGIAKLRQFYGNERIAAAFVACTARHPFAIAEGVEARTGWRTWEV